MSAAGLRAATWAAESRWPTSSEYTRASRTRRAISWLYCPPRSTTRTGRSSGVASGVGSGTTFATSAPVVRSVLRDGDAVRVALVEAGWRDAREPCACLHVVHRRGTAVPHRLPQ